MDAPETAEDHWNHDLHQRFPGFPAEGNRSSCGGIGGGWAEDDDDDEIRLDNHFEINYI